MSNVLILGATSDIARAVAHEFARRGHTLTLAARDVGRLTADVDDLKIRYSISVSAVVFEATAPQSHAAFFAALSPVPDIVVCAVGTLGDQTLAQTDFVEVRRICETNFLGCVSVLDQAAKVFEERGQGSIIGIGSVAGDRGRVGNYYYGSAKAAFAAYLSGLRVRLFPKKVHVMTVKPGFVRTAMTRGLKLPEKLVAEPASVARRIVRACERRRSVIYTPGYWRLIMFVIKALPEFVFKRMKI